MNKREQSTRMQHKSNKPKKTMSVFERQTRRNQLIFILLSALLILTMVISLIRF